MGKTQEKTRIFSQYRVSVIFFVIKYNHNKNLKCSHSIKNVKTSCQFLSYLKCIQFLDITKIDFMQGYIISRISTTYKY